MALLVVLLTGCTQNNGHIGKLFGQWQLESITVEGYTEAPEYDGILYMSFQTSVVQLAQMKDHHELSMVYGNYRYEDNTLFIDLADNPGGYPQLGISSKAEFQVLELTGKKLVLQRPGLPRGTLIYNFRKW